MGLTGPHCGQMPGYKQTFRPVGLHFLLARRPALQINNELGETPPWVDMRMWKLLLMLIFVMLTSCNTSVKVQKKIPPELSLNSVLRISILSQKGSGYFSLNLHPVSPDFGEDFKFQMHGELLDGIEHEFRLPGLTYTGQLSLREMRLRPPLYSEWTTANIHFGYEYTDPGIFSMPKAIPYSGSRCTIHNRKNSPEINIYCPVLVLHPDRVSSFAFNVSDSMQANLFASLQILLQSYLLSPLVCGFLLFSRPVDVHTEFNGFAQEFYGNE